MPGLAVRRRVRWVAGRCWRVAWSVICLWRSCPGLARYGLRPVAVGSRFGSFNPAARGPRCPPRQLICVKPGCRPRLIYRTHTGRRHRASQRKGFTVADYARLLDAAHRQLNGRIVLVWDNLRTHVSGTMTDLAAARDWLTVYQLPPYAHELNPVEAVWSHLKRSLANLAKRNISQLTAPVKTWLKRMQYRPSLLDGFLAHTGLDLTPFCNPHH
jgi:transposase